MLKDIFFFIGIGAEIVERKGCGGGLFVLRLIVCCILHAKASQQWQGIMISDSVQSKANRSGTRLRI